ncbi:MASE2 domain-containing protein, partial [Salmonella enterica]
ALMLINGFVWPHLAYQWARRTANTLRCERHNLLFDSFCGGFWVGAMHFNPLPSVTTLSMMTMNNVAIGGPRFMLAGWVAQALGVGVSLLIFTPAFI